MDAPNSRWDRPLGVAAGPDGSIYVADQQDHVVRRLAPRSVINSVFDLPGSNRSGQTLTDYKDPVGRSIYRVYTVAGVRLRAGRQERGRLRRLHRRRQRLRRRAERPRHRDALPGRRGRRPQRRPVRPRPGQPARALDSLNPDSLQLSGVPRHRRRTTATDGTPGSIDLRNPRHVLGRARRQPWDAGTDCSVVRRIAPDGQSSDVVAGTGNRGGNFDPDRRHHHHRAPGLADRPGPRPGRLRLHRRPRAPHHLPPEGPASSDRFAGNGRSDFLGPTGYSAEGRLANQEPLNSPAGVAVAVDPAGNVYIADTLKSRCAARWTPAAPSPPSPAPAPTATTATASRAIRRSSGSPKTSPGTTAPSTSPTRATPPSASRDPATGIVTTVAGTGNSAGYGGDNGPATSALLNSPTDLTFGTDGSMFIADTFNNRVRKVTPDGRIVTVAGTGATGEFRGRAAAAQALLRGPRGVTLDSRGHALHRGHREQPRPRRRLQRPHPAAAHADARPDGHPVEPGGRRRRRQTQRTRNTPAPGLRSGGVPRRRPQPPRPAAPSARSGPRTVAGRPARQSIGREGESPMRRFVLVSVTALLLGLGPPALRAASASAPVDHRHRDGDRRGHDRRSRRDAAGRAPASRKLRRRRPDRQAAARTAPWAARSSASAARSSPSPCR